MDRNVRERQPCLLLIATLDEVGGVGSYIAMLLPALVKDFDVVVAAHGRGPLRDTTLAAGARYVPLEHVRRPIDPWRDVLGLIELIRLCRRERPTILHANSSKAGVLGRLAGTLAGVPIRIFSVHGWAFSVPGTSRTILWAERLVSPLTSVTICVAAYDRELGIAARTCSRERTVVVHNGIDAGRFEPVERDGADVPTIVFVGRLAAQKDIWTLLAALAKLERGSYRAALIGSGPDEQQVRAEVDRLGLLQSVDLLGERRDVPRLLSQADIFVLASIYESLPISVLEAMAAGLPVVATDVGGVRELVADGKTGFVVPSRDPDALAAALRVLLLDGELRRRLGRSGRARVVSDFGVERFRHEHVALYETELARRGLLSTPAAELTVGPGRLRAAFHRSGRPRGGPVGRQ